MSSVQTSAQAHEALLRQARAHLSAALAALRQAHGVGLNVTELGALNAQLVDGVDLLDRVTRGSR